MTLIKVLINWQKRTDGFWQLIKTSNNGILGFFKFRSTAKIRQFFFGSWSNFSINWKASKNLVNWLWKFRSTDKTQFWSTDFRSNNPLSVFSHYWISRTDTLSVIIQSCLIWFFSCSCHWLPRKLGIGWFGS